MKIINKKQNQLTFKAEIDESLTNAIRRYVNQIPIIAINEVEISKNDSPLYDETIAHRLGLIPLKIESSISISDKSPIKLKLNTNKEGTVYSGELKGKIKPVYDKMPITVLKKGQELELTGITGVGKGNQHAKFSPGLIFYRNIMEVKIKPDCPKEVIESCPKNIFKERSGKIIAETAELCDMCEACLETCKKLGKPDCIELIPTNELIITIESFGQIDVKDIFRKAIDVLKKDLGEVSKKIERV